MNANNKFHFFSEIPVPYLLCSLGLIPRRLRCLVTPAKAGVQSKILDSGLRRNDNRYTAACGRVVY